VTEEQKVHEKKEQLKVKKGERHYCKYRLMKKESPSEARPVGRLQREGNSIREKKGGGARLSGIKPGHSIPRRRSWDCKGPREVRKGREHKEDERDREKVAPENA